MPADPLLALTLFLAGIVAAALPLGLAMRRLRRHTSGMADFLASMSHDIRTPMNGVIGFADLLSHQGNLTPEQRRNVDNIAQSGHTMVRLLNDILDFSKAEAGCLRLEQVELSLHDELAYCTALFQPRASEKGLVLACVIDPEVPARIIGDPLRLRQVLLNLVGNAVKFTDSGRVQIHAKARRGVLSTQLVIAVHDTGIGIAPKAIGKIFGRYMQADSAIARSHGGSGLGLAICAQLVTLMEGRIDVTSQPGKGSVFAVHLPVHALADQTVPLNRRLAAAA